MPPLVTHNERIQLGPDDVVGATYVPGFQPDLTGWKLWIDRFGRLRQEVQADTPENRYRRAVRKGTVAIDPAEVKALLQMAEAAGFWDLPAEYESSVTDDPTISVAIRFPEGVKTVWAYGAFWAACMEENAAMVRLVRVWLQIHRHAFDRPAWLREWLSPGSSVWASWRRLRRSLRCQFNRPAWPWGFWSGIVEIAMARNSPQGQVVKLLEAVHYPWPPRPPDRVRFGWKAIKVRNPTWEEIEAAVRRLDRDEWPYLRLHTERPPRDAEPDNFFCVIGGRGEYDLCLYRDNDEIRYYDPARGDRIIQIWESDQGSEGVEKYLCNDLAVALEATKYFATTGELHPAYRWRDPLWDNEGQGGDWAPA